MTKAKKQSFTQTSKRPLIIGFILAALAGLTIWGFVGTGTSEETTPLSKRPSSATSDQAPGHGGTTAAVKNRITVPAENELTLAWFSATWCEICKTMRPFINQVVAEFPNVHLEEHDVDQEAALAQRFRVRGTPTFVFINAADKEILRFNGASENGFRQQIQGALNLI